MKPLIQREFMRKNYRANESYRANRRLLSLRSKTEDRLKIEKDIGARFILVWVIQQIDNEIEELKTDKIIEEIKRG